MVGIIKNIHLLRLKGMPIYQQLQLEEALLRADDRNWCILNEGTPPAIVMGISGRQELLVDPDKMQASPVPLIRRFSGGGTVFVDHNTHFVTLIGDAVALGIPCCPSVIHCAMIDVYRSAFSHLPIELRENDYVIGQRKWGGNAQYLTKNRWLHHTSILWDYDPNEMDRLLIPQKMPHYRQKRRHDDFLCRLSHYMNRRQDIEENMINLLHRRYSIKMVDISEVTPLLGKPHRQMTTLLN